MDGGGWLVGERKGTSVAAALSFRRRAALQEMSASRIDQSERETNEKRDDVGVAAETRWMDGGGWLVGERKGPSVAAALSFRRRAALQETSASRIRRGGGCGCSACNCTQ